MPMFKKQPYQPLGNAADMESPFDYNLESNTVKRRQKIADMLRGTATGSNDTSGRTISNAAGTWYVPGSGEGIGGFAAKLASGLLSNKIDGQADERQSEIDKFSDSRYDERRKQIAAEILKQQEYDAYQQHQATDEENFEHTNAAAEAGQLDENGQPVLPEITVRPKMEKPADSSRSILAAMLREGDVSKNYAAQRIAAMDALPTPDKYSAQKGDDGSLYVFNESKGRFEKDRTVQGAPKLDTQVVEANGRKVLINSKTGEPIKDLGSSATAADTKAAKKEANEAAEADVAFQDADAELQGTIDELRTTLERKGSGSIEDTTGAYWDAGKRNLPGTAEYDTKFNIERTLSQKIIGGLKQMKAAGVGTSAFNSDKEAERLEKAFGSINWSSEPEARRQLNNIMSDLLNTQQRMRSAYEAKTGKKASVPGSGGVSLSDFDAPAPQTGGASGSW